MPNTLLLDPPSPLIFRPSKGSENVVWTNEVLDTTTQWHSKKDLQKFTLHILTISRQVEWLGRSAVSKKDPCNRKNVLSSLCTLFKQ